MKLPPPMPGWAPFALAIHLDLCLGFWKRSNFRGGGSERPESGGDAKIDFTISNFSSRSPLAGASTQVKVDRQSLDVTVLVDHWFQR